MVTCRAEGKTFTLRVIGLPEEAIFYQDDTLYVNGEPIDEKFIVDEINQANKKNEFYTASFSMNLFGDINTIPKGCYLLLGDNRMYGNDSRYFGLVAENEINEIVLARLFPVNEYQLF